MALVCSKAFVLRQAVPEDEPFLYRLYASTRADELAAWGWNATQQELFLQLQFRAQQQHYAAYPNTTHHIIQETNSTEGQPWGRLLTARLAEEIRLVDLALLPEFRQHGIGTTLVRELQTEARQSGQALRLHVAADNRARHWYERLGFHLLEDRGTHWFMEWRAVNSLREETN